jgi:outer membrane protein OmpA-like peptidoglycan-associated protein
MELKMSRHIPSWRHFVVAGTISLLGACAQTSPARVASTPPAVPPGPDATWYHIEFMTNSHTIGAQGQLTVADVTNMLRKNPNDTVTIIGKTDTVGGASYNIHLSHMRADSVRDALVYNGKVAADRVETRWTGETRQRLATVDNVSTDVNRVVDIAVH